MLEATSGMTHICISYVQIKSYEDVLQRKKFLIYWILAMLQHMEDILVDTEQLPRFYNQVITGILFLKMFMSLLNVVTCVKEQET